MYIHTYIHKKKKSVTLYPAHSRIGRGNPTTRVLPYVDVRLKELCNTKTFFVFVLILIK